MPEICARARGGHRLFYAKSVLKGRCYFRIAGEQGKMDAYRNRYTGDISQVFNAKTFRYETGRARGVLASQINNGGGLDVTVLADRCMDMAHVLYKGINISYINSCGITHPAYYEAEGENWLRGFSAGLLTTWRPYSFRRAQRGRGEALRFAWTHCLYAGRGIQPQNRNGKRLVRCPAGGKDKAEQAF